MNSVVGIGYEGSDIASFISRLRVRGVETVVDVRLTPISRKRGFSKRALIAALSEAGVGYVHMPQLGNPKENREGYATIDDEGAGGARDRFEAMLQGERASAAIDQIVALAVEGNVALLCFEASEEHCHRQQVLEGVRERRIPTLA